MSQFKRILVAVKDPDARRQPGIEKALHIAAKLGASVELFNAISTPVFLELEPLTGRSMAQIKREALDLRHKRLLKWVTRARKRGIDASCAVEWDFPPHEAIVRRAVRMRADLIVAECHQGIRLKPWLLRLTDWELLRTSPVPLLLLKSPKRWKSPGVLAAVDPSHAHDKPLRLDSVIVDRAQGLARALGGTCELVHANFPTGFGLAFTDPGIDAATLAAAYERQRQSGRRRFEDFAATKRVSRTCRHLVDSDPAFAIPQVAREIGAQVVVMGAISRSGLKRVFIGNTAERILNDLPCDVLVVKPGHQPARVAAKTRGMRVVAPGPITPAPM
jgi:universal stress protein E